MDSELDCTDYYDGGKLTAKEMVKEFYNKSGKFPNPFLAWSLIIEEMSEFQKATDRANELKEMADVIYVLYGYALAMGWDLDEALQRVHDNNVGRMVWDDGRIYRDDDGKVIKNPNHPKIDLGDLV